MGHVWHNPPTCSRGLIGFGGALLLHTHTHACITHTLPPKIPNPPPSPPFHTFSPSILKEPNCPPSLFPRVRWRVPAPLVCKSCPGPVSRLWMTDWGPGLPPTTPPPTLFFFGCLFSNQLAISTSAHTSPSDCRFGQQVVCRRPIVPPQIPKMSAGCSRSSFSLLLF